MRAWETPGWIVRHRLHRFVPAVPPRMKSAGGAARAHRAKLRPMLTLDELKAAMLPTWPMSRPSVHVGDEIEGERRGL